MIIIIKEVVGFDGDLEFDKSKPEGTPQKLLNISRLKNLGWAPTVTLDEGIRKSYEWYLKQVERNSLIANTYL